MYTISPVPPGPPRFQFTIATALYFTTAAAVLCSLAAWNRGFPYWTVLPGLLLVLAWVVARRGRSSDLSWGLLTIGWLIALTDLVDEYCEAVFCCADLTPQAAPGLQAAYVQAYASAIALPLLLSMPVVRLAARRSEGSVSRGRKWVIACGAVALVDASVLMLFLVLMAPEMCRMP